MKAILCAWSYVNNWLLFRDDLWFDVVASLPGAGNPWQQGTLLKMKGEGRNPFVMGLYLSPAPFSRAERGGVPSLVGWFILFLQGNMLGLVRSSLRSLSDSYRAGAGEASGKRMPTALAKGLVEHLCLVATEVILFALWRTCPGASCFRGHTFQNSHGAKYWEVVTAPPSQLWLIPLFQGYLPADCQTVNY